MKAIKVVLIFSLILFVSNIFAAQQRFKFKKIDFQYRTVTPENSNISGFDRSKLIPLAKMQGWGIVEAIYNSEPKWADNVEIKYYVLMKGETGKEPVMLTGSIVYVDVQKGSQHVSTTYIPPQAILRYGEVIKIRAEVWYNGILEDAVQWPSASSAAQWWNKVKPIYGALLNRFYTPFEHEVQGIEEVIKIE